ncbi:MAG: hypothetical protein MOGMAGMI_00603 [Candidatus Omnitrophica bacterium]|nr:hypothetical protein [Candidatus Omnitrophota bacterium]
MTKANRRKIDQSLRLAVKNVATFGDTDIFPTFLDKYACYDNEEDVISELLKVHRDFDRNLESFAPDNITLLAPLGYTSFRWATQIDPIWNIYLLGLILHIAPAIERSRLAAEKKTVFSYRFNPKLSSGHLFTDSTWSDYKRRAIELSENHKYVLVTDIADFYHRIAHHRLDNELSRIESSDTETTKRIMKLLGKFSHTRSYGLPVGGPSSRILAELALKPIDTHLDMRSIVFCRYVDDYHVFANSKEDAHKHLARLADMLFNEGLSLQKNKTRIMETAELLEVHARLEGDSDKQGDERALMRISLKYDPYSPTAEEDYEVLKAAVSSIDIAGILLRETSKTNIDAAVTKQAIGAVKALPQAQKEDAISSLLDQRNVEVLAPVFIHILRLLRDVYSELSEAKQKLVDERIIEMLEAESYITNNELTLSYVVQLLGRSKTNNKERLLIKTYDIVRSSLVRREIILVMAEWGCTYWLTGLLRQFSTLSRWERKAIIRASYSLGDEGSHWRKNVKNGFSPGEKIVQVWAQNKVQAKSR